MSNWPPLIEAVIDDFGLDLINQHKNQTICSWCLCTQMSSTTGHDNYSNPVKSNSLFKESGCPQGYNLGKWLNQLDDPDQE